MALTQKEIRIRAGLDYSGVTFGLNSIRVQVNKLATDVPKKLGSLLKANVYAAAGDMLATLAGKATDAWLKIFGQDQAYADARKKTAAQLAAFAEETVRQLNAAQAAYDKAAKSAFFGRQDTEGKLKLLREEEQLINRQIAATERLIKVQQQQIADFKPRNKMEMDARNRLILEEGRSKADLLNLKARGEGVGADISKLFETDLKETGAKFKEKLAGMPTGETAPSAPSRKLSYAEGVAARAAKWQDHINAVNRFGKPIVPEAAPPDPSKVVIPVRIVDIEEK